MEFKWSRLDLTQRLSLVYVLEGCFLVQCFGSTLESIWFPVCDQSATSSWDTHEYTQEAVCRRAELRLCVVPWLCGMTVLLGGNCYLLFTGPKFIEKQQQQQQTKKQNQITAVAWGCEKQELNENICNVMSFDKTHRWWNIVYFTLSGLNTSLLSRGIQVFEWARVRHSMAALTPVKTWWQPFLLIKNERRHPNYLNLLYPQ